jgi:multidrug efflux pump subunit AcrA (membrane-fusion protein)
MISRPFVTALSVFALSVFALLLNGCSQAPAIKRAPIISEPSVTIDRTKLGDVMRTILVTGSLMAFEDISLSAKQGGRISEVLVREGDKVKAGQVLAKVDPADLISQVESDEAAVVSDRAKVAQSQAAYDQQVSDTEAGIVSAKAALDQQLATANAQVRSAELAVASAKESLSTSLEGARPSQLREVGIGPESLLATPSSGCNFGRGFRSVREQPKRRPRQS